MSEPRYPVTVAVSRPDGSVEQVRVGTAIRRGDGFALQLGDLTIGATPAQEPAPRRAAQQTASSAPPPPAGSGGGMVFPPYGRSKGAPIAGASLGDLEYYAAGCRRTLSDPGKARWHEKERQLLAAIEAETARQGHGGAPPPSDDDAPPPPRDEDNLPF